MFAFSSLYRTTHEIGKLRSFFTSSLQLCFVGPTLLPKITTHCKEMGIDDKLHWIKKKSTSVRYNFHYKCPCVHHKFHVCPEDVCLLQFIKFTSKQKKNFACRRTMNFLTCLDSSTKTKTRGEAQKRRGGGAGKEWGRCKGGTGKV